MVKKQKPASFGRGRPPKRQEPNMVLMPDTEIQAQQMRGRALELAVKTYEGEKPQDIIATAQMYHTWIRTGRVPDESAPTMGIKHEQADIEAIPEEA